MWCDMWHAFCDNEKCVLVNQDDSWHPVNYHNDELLQKFESDMKLCGIDNIAQYSYGTLSRIKCLFRLSYVCILIWWIFQLILLRNLFPYGDGQFQKFVYLQLRFYWNVMLVKYTCYSSLYSTVGCTIVQGVSKNAPNLRSCSFIKHSPDCWSWCVFWDTMYMETEVKVWLTGSVSDYVTKQTSIPAVWCGWYTFLLIDSAHFRFLRRCCLSRQAVVSCAIK